MLVSSKAHTPQGIHGTNPFVQKYSLASTGSGAAAAGRCPRGRIVLTTECTSRVHTAGRCAYSMFKSHVALIHSLLSTPIHYIAPGGVVCSNSLGLDQETSIILFARYSRAVLLIYARSLPKPTTLYLGFRQQYEDDEAEEQQGRNLVAAGRGAQHDCRLLLEFLFLVGTAPCWCLVCRILYRTSLKCDLILLYSTHQR